MSGVWLRPGFCYHRSSGAVGHDAFGRIGSDQDVFEVVGRERKSRKRQAAHIAKGELEVHSRFHSRGDRSGAVLRARQKTASQEVVDSGWNQRRLDATREYRLTARFA